MSRGLAAGLTAVAGALVALQAPINSRLGKGVGTFPAAVVSFTTGLVLLLAVSLVAAGGLGSLGELGRQPWWAFLGGLLGAGYVASVLVTVRTLGATGVIAATIAGQLTAAVLIDHYGLLGVARHPLAAPRLGGIVLLAAGVFLIVRR
ncbi:MAG: bacterial/archaeal transporter family-2 protein [Solirubrobacteraceae bacterium]|jgi:transporter family-2 protein|nr:bacterial/archaeal transporter family-2 protein [Solirubrobacteraceae bacterium]